MADFDSYTSQENDQRNDYETNKRKDESESSAHHPGYWFRFFLNLCSAQSYILKKAVPIT